MTPSGSVGALVARLDRRIVRSTHRLERAVLRAERAGVLVRLGRMPEASAEIAWLRSEFEACPYPEISVRLLLAEAWQAYFTEFSAQASDQIQRAYAISRSAGLTDELALSAAWLAHMECVQLDFDGMVEHVLEALHWAAPDAHDARARACLVVADAYHQGGAPESAQAWTAQARFHALADGDAPTLSAINHHLAWHSTLRAAHVGLWERPEAARAEAGRALTAAHATHEFDTCRGTTDLPRPIQVAKALAYSVLGESQQALSLYEAYAPQAEAEGLRPLRPLVLADMALCHATLGHSDLARHYLQASEEAHGLARHLDDRALIHGRLAQVNRLLGDVRQATSHRRRARVCWRQHLAVRDELLVALHTFEARCSRPVAFPESRGGAVFSPNAS